VEGVEDVDKWVDAFPEAVALVGARVTFMVVPLMTTCVVVPFTTPPEGPGVGEGPGVLLCGGPAMDRCWVLIGTLTVWALTRAVPRRRSRLRRRERERTWGWQRIVFVDRLLYVFQRPRLA
jgi:hypothetical protein